MTGSTTKNKHGLIAKTVMLTLIIGVWQGVSLTLPSIILPSPLETIHAFLQISQSGELVEQLSLSFIRMINGFVIGFSIAFLMGLIAGKYSFIYEAFRPLQSLLLGIPPIIFVVLAMIWFGTGGFVPVFVVAILVFPTIFLNTADGWRNIDHQLIEMAMVYKTSPFHTLRHIILPSLTVPVLTGVALALGSAIRITVMAELLGADDGMGYSIALARVNIDTAKVFAWTLVSILLVMIIDNIFINPMKKYTQKWKTGA